MNGQRACWCGNAALQPFNDDYARCPVCETLVLARVGERRLDRVENDASDFYGREYWFAHQEEELGHANLFVRARQDLVGRCLFWLRTLLTYRRPAGTALELGCAHGAFVGLLRWAGFDAAGLELSPTIAEFARRAFDVPIYVGPVEEQNIPRASQDLIVAMDVLEHLEDPLGTLRHAVPLLRPDAILFVQTPCYPHGKTFEQLTEEGSAFLEMLLPKEHVYLYSQPALERLLREAGLVNIEFVPAIFGHYDMSAVASNAPVTRLDVAETDRVLAATAGGRLVRALLDLDERNVVLHQSLAESAAHVGWLKSMIDTLEDDRARRLAVIEQQGAQLGRIPGYEADIAHLIAQVQAAEADRAARLELIHQQGDQLGRIPGLEADVAHLIAQLTSAEADRAARLEVIERQSTELSRLPALEADVTYLTSEVERLEAERVRLLGLLERGAVKVPASKADPK